MPLPAPVRIATLFFAQPLVGGPARTQYPFPIGPRQLGYDEAELTTIYPQPHDVPMDLIVRERRVFRFAR
jgi:hypothetical protein